MTNEIDQFMNEQGAQGSPSFKFEGLEDGLRGPVLSVRVIDQTDPSTNPPTKVIDQATGQPKKQLEITIQTTFRGWQKVAKIPMDTVTLPNGGSQTVPRDPSADDGKRRIFAGGNMVAAIGDAVAKASGETTRSPAVGGVLGVKWVGSRDTGKPSPLKLYAAIYDMPNPADAFMQQQAPVAQQQYVQQQVSDPNSQLGQVAQPQYAPPVQQPVYQAPPPQQPQYQQPVAQPQQPQYAPPPPPQQAPVQQPVADPFGQPTTYPDQPPF